MRLRQALIEQSPSLALQRAAADEIAALDAMILKQREMLEQPASVPAGSRVVENRLLADLRDSMFDYKRGIAFGPVDAVALGKLDSLLAAAPQAPQPAQPHITEAQWREVFSEAAHASVLAVDELQARSIRTSVDKLLAAPSAQAPQCTCPSGDGSLRWPCPVHPPSAQAEPYRCPAKRGEDPQVCGRVRCQLGRKCADEVQAEQGGK